MTTVEVSDGCLEHNVIARAVEERWEAAKSLNHPLLAMCRCCFGPALVDSFDERGVGQGEMLCSRCK